MRVPSLSHPVDVHTDRWGVTHVYAESVDDLYFAQGFVVARDRLWQIELASRTSYGTLAALPGESALAVDIEARTRGAHLAGQRVRGAMSDLDLQIWARWEAGVRTWLEVMDERPPEYALLGRDPELPDDLCVRLASVTLSAEITMWPTVLLRAAVIEQLGADVAALLLPTGASDVTTGSNAWAVGASRTATGGALVAYDPHLPFSTPGYKELHLCAPGFEVSGAGPAFLPGVVMARGRRHAWGVTSALGATAELYEERLDEAGASAFYEGAWEPLQVRREDIAVQGRSDPVVLEIKESRHGPLIDGRYSLAMVERGPFSPGVMHRLASAESFAEFREVLRDVRFLNWNVVYGDADGHIGYQLVGPWPRRRGRDGSLPVPGWSNEHEWGGLIPFDELPWSFDPPEGFVASCNDDPHDARFGRDFASPHRIRRVTDMLSRTTRHTVETMIAIQTDTVSLLALEMLPFLEHELLHGWDGDLAVDSAPAALFEVWMRHLMNEVMQPILGEELLSAYDAAKGGLELPRILAVGDHAEAVERARSSALAELTARLGEDPQTWRWGALHHLPFKHPLSDRDVRFTAGDVPLPGDGSTVCCASHTLDWLVTSGAIYRQVVDLADLDRTVTSIAPGNSGHPDSEHYGDLMHAWARGEYHPAGHTHQEVARVTIATLELRP